MDMECFGVEDDFYLEAKERGYTAMKYVGKVCSHQAVASVSQFALLFGVGE